MYNLWIRIIAGIGLSNSVIDNKSQTSILKIKKKLELIVSFINVVVVKYNHSFVGNVMNTLKCIIYILNGSKAINIYYINKHISKVNHT